MMKKIFVFCSLLLLSAQTAAAGVIRGPRLLDTWSLMNTWESGMNPVDFAQTLDKKLAFVLGEDGNVQIYSAVGEQFGMIPLQNQPVAIDISPRGRTLYAVDQSGTCTIFNIPLESGSMDWSVRNRWRTQARPMDIASLPDRELVFILEADSIIRVYSYAGKLLHYLPVPAGISGLDLVPRSNMLYLINRNGFYAALKIGL